MSRKGFLGLLTLALLLAAVLTAVSPGRAQGPVDEGASPPPGALPGTKAARYPRLAIVAAPGQGSDPQMSAVILDGAASVTAKYLSFLQRVDCIPNVPVDLTQYPPLVKLPAPDQYDAVAVLVHSQPGDKIYLDINVLDAKTGVKLWNQQLHAKADRQAERFKKLGILAPKRLMKYFYRD